MKCRKAPDNVAEAVESADELFKKTGTECKNHNDDPLLISLLSEKPEVVSLSSSPKGSEKSVYAKADLDNLRDATELAEKSEMSYFQSFEKSIRTISRCGMRQHRGAWRY